MNKKTLLLVTIAVLLVVSIGAAYYLSNKRRDSQTTSTEQTNSTDATATVLNKKWKLVELYDNAVTGNAESHYMKLNSDGNTLHASAGCNQLTSTFTLDQRLVFTSSAIASTKKACEDMQTEQQLSTAIESADNVTISADGKTLSLNKGKVAPLARFELAD